MRCCCVGNPRAAVYPSRVCRPELASAHDVSEKIIGRCCALVNPTPGGGSGPTIRGPGPGWLVWNPSPSACACPLCLPHRPSVSPWPSMGEGGLMGRRLACLACLAWGSVWGGLTSTQPMDGTSQLRFKRRVPDTCVTNFDLDCTQDS